MYSYFLVIAALLLAAPAFAQTPQALPTDPAAVQNLLESSGCHYEIGTASQTIAQLQKQINELKDQLKKLDPPKSGATKK